MKHLKAKYFLFLFTNPVSKPNIIIVNPANLDNGIRALPRFSGAEGEQEEGAAL